MVTYAEWLGEKYAARVDRSRLHIFAENAHGSRLTKLVFTYQLDHLCDAA